MAGILFPTGIDFVKSEIQNAVIQRLSSAPGSPVGGQVYYNTTDNKSYYYNGSAWVDMSGGGGGGITALTGDVSASGSGSVAATVNSVGGATAANVADAVTKRHTQHTDTGTTSATFQIDSGNSGPKVKNSGGEVQLRNAADSAYADLRVGNLTVTGSTTAIDSNTVNIGDNEILLNSDVAASGSNSDGGVAVKRLDTDNTTRRDAKVLFNESTDRWELTYGPHTAAMITRQAVAKHSLTIGNASATSFTVAQSTHGLAADASMVVSVYDASTGDQVFPRISINNSNGTVTVDFGATVPASNAYRVVIIG